jgi:hypothetical protein
MSERGSSGRLTHDLKNQIGIVLGVSELLLQDLDPADPRLGDVQEIHTAACRAMKLLQDASARPKAGSREPDVCSTFVRR